MYVNRKDGKIVSTFTCQQYKGQEFIADNAAELIDARAKRDAAESDLLNTETLIRNKMREIAIAALKAEGKM